MPSGCARKTTTLTPHTELARENWAIPALAIPVPRTLRGARPVVIATRDKASGLKAGEDGRLDIGREPGIAHLQVSRGRLNRALRILQSVLAEAERRGYDVVPVEKSYNHAAGLGLKLRSATYALKLYELRDKVPLTDAQVMKWEHEHRFSLFAKNEPQATRPVANGRLALSIEYGYGSGRRSNWREGPRGALETKLESFFAELEARAIEDEQEARRRAIEREQRELKLEAQRERHRQAQVDEARGGRLVAEARAWREADDSRAYLKALKARLAHLGAAERERLEAWVDWAEDWVERNDPVVNTERIRGFDESRQSSPS